MELTQQTWDAWLAAAHAVNQHKPADRPSVGNKWQNSGPPSDDSPGTDFNRRGSWADTGLFDAGWQWQAKRGEEAGLITRPGKDPRDGCSASIGVVTSQKNGWPFFYCWSGSVPEFKTEVPYTRFAVYAILNHGGDFTAAARELGSKGYGKRMPDVRATFNPPEPGDHGGGKRPDGADDTEADRIFKWMSELRRQPEGTKWLWEGFISRGGVTMFSALWKIGKTTMLGYLVRAFDGRSTEFLGQKVTPSKVLYVTEEHEELWAERRDEMGIADHVGMVCRPFRGKPSPAEWVAFIGKLVQAVAEHQFDLVILDTISKLWPVREENDASQVEEALMPLWAITNTGAALFLVHHTRKAGGGEFTGSRGSGGLPAFCETLIEFRRADDQNTKDPKRVLNAKGRYRETPDKRLIELTPAGYVSHGDPDDTAVRVVFSGKNWKEKVCEFLPTTEPGMTAADIQAKLGDKGVRKADLVAWLEARVEDGEFYTAGEGKKGDPKRWWKVD